MVSRAGRAGESCNPLHFTTFSTSEINLITDLPLNVSSLQTGNDPVFARLLCRVKLLKHTPNQYILGEAGGSSGQLRLSRLMFSKFYWRGEQTDLCRDIVDSTIKSDPKGPR